MRRRTITGYDLELEWKYGITSWLPLKEVKETKSVDIAKYARDNDLMEQPAFTWWDPHKLKKQTRLIKLAQHRTKRNRYKFGIRIPKTIEEALDLNKENGNHLWEDSAMK